MPTAKTKKSPTTSPKTSRKKTTRSQVTLLDQEQLHEKIRHKAYELYLERGCQGGDAQQDWLTAEKLVLQSVNFINYA